MSDKKITTQRGGLVIGNTGSSLAKGESLFTDFGRDINVTPDIRELRRRFGDKRILNLGCSNNGYIESVIQDLSPSAKVLSLDPALASSEDIIGVRALAQELPFLDGSVDIVMSTWSFPLLWHEAMHGHYTLLDEESVPPAQCMADLDRIASEIFRVLAPGGEAWLSPLNLYFEMQTTNEPVAALTTALSMCVMNKYGLKNIELKDCWADHSGDTFKYQSGIFKKEA